MCDGECKRGLVPSSCLTSPPCLHTTPISGALGTAAADIFTSARLPSPAATLLNVYSPFFRVGQVCSDLLIQFQNKTLLLCSWISVFSFLVFFLFRYPSLLVAFFV